MAKTPRSLAGKIVAITGGARGIGRATASALVAQGARIFESQQGKAAIAGNEPVLHAVEDEGRGGMLFHNSAPGFADEGQQLIHFRASRNLIANPRHGLRSIQTRAR